MPNKLYRNYQGGQAILVAVLFLTIVSVVVISGLVSPSIRNLHNANKFVGSRASYYTAEAGVEDAIYRLKNGLNTPSTNTINLNGGSATVNVVSSGNDKTISVAGVVTDLYRKIEASVTAGVGVSFYYGVQVGDGGLRMENSSTVVGNVYSSGKVWGGGGSGSITGDVFVSGTSEINDPPDITGHAQAHKISNVRIGKDAKSTTAMNATTVLGKAYADTYLNSHITGDAYYKTSISGTTVGGTTYPNTPPPADLPDVPLPISDDQISQWEALAEAGGIYTGPCAISSGTVSVGFKKINCDLTISNSATLNVTGPLWVVGNINLLNSSKVKLDPAYGAGSEVIIADNPSNRLTSSKIVVANFSQILGSGTAGSYVTMISQNNSAELGGAQFAINQKNNTVGQVFYAPHGEVKIENSPTAKEVTAYEIHMTNSSALTYETGLVNLNFSSGPGGGYQISSWQETP